MLYDLYDEFQNLTDKLILLINETNRASWEKATSDLALPLIRILCRESRRNTKPPLILSSISENDRIFHPFRKSEFQLIYSEALSIGTDQGRSQGYTLQKLAIFTIPMLYSPARESSLTKDEMNSVDSSGKPTREGSLLPFSKEIELEECKEISITITINGKYEQIIPIIEEIDNKKFYTDFLVTHPIYEFVYENPFEENPCSKLTLKKWLQQPVLMINRKAFSIENILKEIRNKIQAHQEKPDKITKESFLYNTRFINVGGPYWSYFIFYCAIYIRTLVEPLLEAEKIAIDTTLVNAFKSAIHVKSRQSLFSATGGFDHKADDSSIAWSRDVEFMANKKFGEHSVRAMFIRIGLENKIGRQFYDIPLIILADMTQEKAELKKNKHILYFNFSEGKCRFDLDFGLNTDYGIQFIKRESKNEKILSLCGIYVSLCNGDVGITQMQIFDVSPKTTD